MDPYADERKKRDFDKSEDLGRQGRSGVIICDSSGLPIDSNLNIELSEEVAGYVTSLIGKGRQVVEALKEGPLNFIRLETSKGETMVAIEENLILIILKGGATINRNGRRDRSGGFLTPYLSSPPNPPDGAGSAKPKERLIETKEKLGFKLLCIHCGVDLPKGQSICHVCGKKVI